MTKRIMLDPGHGGGDPGAIGPRKKEEEDISLKICEYLQDKIHMASQHQAFLTRTGDYRVSLQERCRLANEQYHADIFISIHCNASVSSMARGTEIYYYRSSKIGEMFAKLVQHQIVEMPLNDWKLIDRGVKGAGFYVLRYTNMPAILVELAFISNPKEEALLDNIDFQIKASGAIFRGLMKFLERR